VILKYINYENNNNDDNDDQDIYVYIFNNVCPSENSCSVRLTYSLFSSIKSFPSFRQVPILECGRYKFGGIYLKTVNFDYYCNCIHFNREIFFNNL
jgi:hypothetical protein